MIRRNRHIAKNFRVFILTAVFFFALPFMADNNIIPQAEKLPVLNGFKAYAKKADDLEIEVHYGYSDKIQVGCYVPFYITVKNNGGNFEGAVQIIVPEMEYNVMYEKDISIAGGSEKTVALTVPVLRYIEKVNVRIVDGHDKVVRNENVKCNIVYSLKSVNIGVLSDDFTALTYMSGQPLFNGYDITTTVYEMSEESIPDDWKALQMIDVIVVTNYSSDKLTSAQISAISKWVEEGGLLLIGTGSTANKTLSNINGKITDIKTGALNNYNTKFGSSLISYMQDNYASDRYMQFGTMNPDGATWDKLEYLIDEYVEYLASSVSDYMAETYELYDYDNVFSKFYATYEKELLLLCKDEFLNEYYGSPNISEDTWISYAQNEFFMCLKDTLYEKMQNSLGNALFSKVVTSAENLPYVNAGMLDFEFEKERNYLFATFYGETSDNDRLFPFAKAITAGNGYIAAAGVDFTQNPFCSYKGNALVFTNILRNIIGDAIFKEADSYNVDIYYYRDRDYDYAKDQVISMASSAAAPPVLLYVFIMSLYLVLCLVAYFVLKKNKKNMLLWIVQPVMALIFAFIIYLAGFTTRLIKPELNVAVITELNGGYETVTSYAAITMPKNKSYEINFSNKYSADLSRRNYYYGNSNTSNLDYYYIGIKPGFDATNIEICNTQSLSTEAFKLSGSNSINGTVVAKLMENDKGGLRGSITNNYGKDLENVYICYFNQIYAVGNIAAGETVEITDESKMIERYGRYYYDYSNRYYSYGYLFGDGANNLSDILLKSGTAERKKENMRYAFYTYSMERLDNFEYDKSGNVYAVLFGFPKDSKERSVQTDGDGGKMKENIYEMITSRISMNQIVNSTYGEKSEYDKYDIDFPFID